MKDNLRNFETNQHKIESKFIADEIRNRSF